MTRLVIAEDSAILRDGLAQLLLERGHDVVAKVGTADELLDAVHEFTPDVAVVDIRMPPTFTDEGLVAAVSLRRSHPDIGVLVFSQWVETRYATELLAGHPEGVGYLLKDRVTDIGEFDAAVRRVAAGGTALDPEVVRQLLGNRRTSDALDRLTPREREVLGEHEHPDVGETRADPLGRDEPLVGERRRHADVDERDVRQIARHRLVQLGGIARRGRHLDAVVPHQRRHAVTYERCVVGDDDAQRGPAAHAPQDLVHGHPSGESREAHLARVAEAQLGLAGCQIAHQRRRECLAIAGERGKPRGQDHRARRGRLVRVDLARVQADRSCGGLLDRDGAPHRLRRTPERERPVAHRDAAVPRSDLRRGRTLALDQDRVRALEEIHGRGASLLRRAVRGAVFSRRARGTVQVEG